MINHAIASLVAYGVRHGLIEQADCQCVTNQLLERLQRNSFTPPEAPLEEELGPILRVLTDYACEHGIIPNDITHQDLFDTGLMSCLTPRPSQIRSTFRTLYAQSPKAATDYYYQLSRDTNYIRCFRIAKNISWKAQTAYGELDITINLSKPELPPTSLEAIQSAPKSGYPLCLLCKENEGYAGRINHPARQNHRLIPLQLDGCDWYLQYSPYVYYNEHCIAFDARHTPMHIDETAFRQLLDFVTQFPHYFLGSNADLPIVGGSIFSHAHYQGGRHTFAMEKAPVEEPLQFTGFEDVSAGIVRWPMSVIRLQSSDPNRLAPLAGKILRIWRGYADESAFIFPETEGVPHSTITPIARRCGEAYVLDLVLRNNITTPEHPLGVFHPHAELHHIKKENIGLIEVMGLAVLPPRLKTELAALEQALLSGTDIAADPAIAKHGPWAEALKQKYSFTPENTHDILKKEVGVAFAQVLEQAGVFKRTAEGNAAFHRFIQTVNNAK